MKLLFENWRQYLTEVSFADAQDILNSKGTIKIIKNYEYLADRVTNRDTAYYHENFKQWLLFTIPDDIEDNQKGTAILWLRNLAKKNPELAKDMILHTNRNTNFALLRSSFETFFHHQRFFPQRDLMQIKSVDDLNQMADEAKIDIDEHRQTQIKSPEMVKEGTTFLRGGWYQPTTSLKGDLSQEEKLETVPENGWVIMEIHNKAASCFHGTADWCTAAPGLDYFEEYYKPTDPLFIFQRVPDIDEDVPQFLQHGHKAHAGGEEKYQFHYGTKSFMDRNDHYVNDEVWLRLHNLLMQTAAPEKYPVVQNHHYYMVAEDRESPPEELDAMAKNPDVPGSVRTRIAKNPATPLETLEYLSRSDNHFVRRAVQVNHAIGAELTIKIFVNNIGDELIYSRGTNDVIRLIKDKKISQQRGDQILDDALAAYVDHKAKIKADFDKRAEADKKEKSVGSLHEHKFKIRIKR